MLRLFVCIWINDEIRNNAVKLQNSIKKLPITAKFVEPENLHITITFLGDVQKSSVDEIKDKLKLLVKGVKKFHVKIEVLKMIPNENYIRVIGVNVFNNDMLSNLIKNIGISLNGKYHEKTKLTLCRVKKIHDKQKILDFIKKNKDIKMGQMIVDKISLVNSKLTKRGPLYETIYTSRLSC